MINNFHTILFFFFFNQKSFGLYSKAIMRKKDKNKNVYKNNAKIISRVKNNNALRDIKAEQKVSQLIINYKFHILHFDGL